MKFDENLKKDCKLLKLQCRYLLNVIKIFEYATFYVKLFKTVLW